MDVQSKPIVTVFAMQAPASNPENLRAQTKNLRRSVAMRQVLEKCPEHLFSTDASALKPLN